MLKFRAKVQGFLGFLDPAFITSSKNIVKEHENSGRITLIVDQDNLSVLADGGRMVVCNMADGKINDFEYEQISSGTVTLQSSSLATTLASFDPTDIIEIEEKTVGNSDSTKDGTAINFTGRELVISPVSEPDTIQTLPILRKDIERKDIVKKIDDSKGVKIRRDIFIDAAKRIFFARGWQDFKVEYQYWVVSAIAGSVRFAAGCGQLFAVLDQQGDSVTDAKSSHTIFIPNDQTPALISCLFNQKSEYISLIPGNQCLTIRCGLMIFRISNLEPNIVWPNVDSVLKRTSPVIITTKMNSWSNTVKGISATYSDDIKQNSEYHIVRLSVDQDKKFLYAKTDGAMKSNRKVAIEDMSIENKQSGLDVQFLSQYLTDCLGKNTNGDEYIQFELDPLTKNAPIIVRYHAKQSVGDGNTFVKINDASGINERYSVFFSKYMGT